jgi:hypothetical protein
MYFQVGNSRTPGLFTRFFDPKARQQGTGLSSQFFGLHSIESHLGAFYNAGDSPTAVGLAHVTFQLLSGGPGNNNGNGGRGGGDGFGSGSGNPAEQLLLATAAEEEEQEDENSSLETHLFGTDEEEEDIPEATGSEFYVAEVSSPSLPIGQGIPSLEDLTATLKTQVGFSSSRADLSEDLMALSQTGIFENVEADIRPMKRKDKPNAVQIIFKFATRDFPPMESL